MRLSLMKPPSRKLLSNNLRQRLRNLVARCGESNKKGTLADLASFLGLERTAPYQWGGRSSPTLKGAVGIALFDVCKGKRDKLAAERMEDIIAVAQQWLPESGITELPPDDEVAAMIREWFEKWGISSWEVTPDIEKGANLDKSLVAVARDLEAIYDKAVRSPKVRVQWHLTLNRLSQVDATEEVAAWLADCHDGRVANYVCETIIPESYSFWVYEQLLKSPNCKHCSIFLDPVGGAPASFFSAMVESLAKAEMPKGKFSVWVNLENAPKTRPPMAIWAFQDRVWRGSFGRLLLPVTTDNPDISDDLTRLDDLHSENDSNNPGSEQKLLWRYHNSPLSFVHALDQLSHRGVVYDKVNRKFGTVNNLQWKQL